MHYVLTADYKVHKIEENSEFNYIERGYLFHKSICPSFVRDSNLGAVLRQANILDQLCDGYVLEENDELVSVYLKRDGWTLDQVKSFAFDGDYKLRGFVKTPNSLLYIARLSSDGSLV